jgi:hypothetical protein
MIKLSQTLEYDTTKALSDQEPEVQEYVNNIAFSYQDPDQLLSISQGEGTPQSPKRFDKAVYSFSTYRIITEFTYRSPWPDFALTGYNVSIEEVINE